MFLFQYSSFTEIVLVAEGTILYEKKEKLVKLFCQNFRIEQCAISVAINLYAKVCMRLTVNVYFDVKNTYLT